MGNLHYDLAIENLKPSNRTDWLTINEIFKKDIYKTKHLVCSGEHWVDIGANIGAFTFKTLLMGASRVDAYEPCERNYSKIKVNIQDGRLFLHKMAVSDYDTEDGTLYIEKNGQWRHTIQRPIRGREQEKIKIIDASQLPLCDGMKLDCEGSEKAIIYRISDRLPNKLVLEYDGGYHPKLKDYNEFISFLKSKYMHVKAPILKRDLDSHFPNGISIQCHTLII